MDNLLFVPATRMEEEQRADGSRHTPIRAWCPVRSVTGRRAGGTHGDREKPDAPPGCALPSPPAPRLRAGANANATLLQVF